MVCRSLGLLQVGIFQRLQLVSELEVSISIEDPTENYGKVK
jgi:hypothetical protein